jgi:tRNA/tmRNA/rRNA uracil-C5-methylase (TrmA/RlmC/RlmD family)
MLQQLCKLAQVVNYHVRHMREKAQEAMTRDNDSSSREIQISQKSANALIDLKNCKQLEQSISVVLKHYKRIELFAIQTGTDKVMLLIIAVMFLITSQGY